MPVFTASAGPLRVRLSALGGSGRRWWFLDGRPLGETAADAAFDQVLDEVGRHQLSLLDEAGATARLEFSVIE